MAGDTHLYSNRCHDESAVWCDKQGYFADGEPADRPEEATCLACLRAVVDFAERAQERLEDWHACSDCGWSGFEFHACPGRPGEGEFIEGDHSGPGTDAAEAALAVTQREINRRAAKAGL